MSQWGRRPAWLKGELWLNLGNRRAYHLWTETQKDYKDDMKLCREKIRRTKAQTELDLATAVEFNETKNVSINKKSATRGGLRTISILFWMWEETEWQRMMKRLK